MDVRTQAVTAELSKSWPGKQWPRVMVCVRVTTTAPCQRPARRPEGQLARNPALKDLLLLREAFQGEAVRIGRTGLHEIRGGQGLQNILLPAPSGCGAASSLLALPLLPRCL